MRFVGLFPGVVTVHSHAWMRSLWLLALISIVGLQGIPSEINAQPSFQGLGVGSANGVSADGSVVVGTSGGEAFRWDATNGMVGLGDLPGGAFSSEAIGVSADGSIVVGRGLSASGFEAFIWDAVNGMVGLGDLPGGAFSSFSRGVSADGSIVVGNGRSTSGGEAFRWDAVNGMVGLGDLPGSVFSSFASAVSADGSIVVGRGASASGQQPFRWDAVNGMVGLGDLPGGGVFGIATAVSADGSVVVGFASSASGPQEAFTWDATNGMVGLGNLPGGGFISSATAVSADGSIVVGSSFTGSGREAFIWDSVNGMRRLQDVLVNEFGLDLSGWTLEQATGISADGLTIVGTGRNPSGNSEAWIARLGEPAPSSPTGLTGTVGNESVILYWNEPTEENDGWNVYGKEATTGAFSLLNSTSLVGPTSGTAFPIHNAVSTPPILLQQGKRYEFLIKAVKDEVESIASSIFSVLVPPRKPIKPTFPVLLLHGIAADASTWDDFKNFVTGMYGWKFGGELSIDPSSPEEFPEVDFDPGSNPNNGDFYTVNFRTNGTPPSGQANYVNDRGVYNEALELAAFLRRLHEVRNDGGEGKFIIVAHSLGGLAARGYIQPANPANYPSDIPMVQFGNDVAHLITYGTPHNGVDINGVNQLFNAGTPCDPLLANVSCAFLGALQSRLYSIIDFDGEVAKDQGLQGSDFLNDLNSRLFPSEIKYTAIIGGSLFASSFLFTGELHDGFVSTNSQDITQFTPPTVNVETRPKILMPGAPLGFYPKLHINETSDVTAILEALGLRSPTHSLVFFVGSPVDIEVTDPQSRKITKGLTEIPGAIYLEYDIDKDGKPNDLVTIPFADPGEYRIAVVPNPGALGTDTYTLRVLRGGSTILLVEDQQIQTIPPQPYTIDVPLGLNIDINPGSDPNSINPRGRGMIPVAILTTDTFDAATVDSTSVEFGPFGAIEAHGRGHIEDIDGDGDDDIVLHFRTQETGIQCGGSQAGLIGMTFNGQAVEGSDSIQTVGCR